MLSEALVIFACANSTGCTETSSHYYNTHPEFQEMLRRNEQEINKLLGPAVIQTAGPVIFAIAGGTGTVRLNRYFNLQASTKKGILFFVREF